ncbi:MAG: hypothetical protein M3P33_02480 [bacterium]|nr:hypothetical protein [bacterium]
MKIIISLIVVFFVFWTVIFTPLTSLYFFSDDFIWLNDAKNDDIGAIQSYFYDSNGFFYRPLTKIYFFVAWRIFGLDGVGYHIVNILLHLLISFMVFLFSYLLLCLYAKNENLTKNRLIAFGSAFLFLVLPAHLENIVWPSAITELFPAFFILIILCLVSYSNLAKINNINLATIYCAIFACFWLALFSHEYAVVAPLLIIATDFYAFLVNNPKFSYLAIKKFFGHKLWFYLILFVIDILYLLVRAMAGSHWSGGDYSYNLVKLPLNFVGNLVGYVGVGVVGIDFINMYQWLREAGRNNLSSVFLIATILVFLLIFIFRFLHFYGFLNVKQNSSNIWFCWYLLLFFVVSLLPFVGLGGIAERYIYLASISITLLMSIAVYFIVEYAIKYYEYPQGASYVVYTLVMLSIGLYYSNLLLRDQTDWRIASEYVVHSGKTFKNECESYVEGQQFVKKSPPNRIGRAWVFQVGYSQSVNLLCDKNLKIILN